MIRSEQGALTNGTRRAILSPDVRSVRWSGIQGSGRGSEVWIDYEEGSTDTRSVYEGRSVRRSVGRRVGSF
ncbi:hypothetical protein GCM10010336_09410 [Streptomyces goshikiensis]|nr:hypothetical protein GCM10010336_09410 [Streptomyces goshikiensis]